METSDREHVETCNSYAEECLRGALDFVSEFDPASSANQRLWRRAGGTFIGLTIGENAAKLVHPLLSCWQGWAEEEECGWDYFAAVQESPVQYAGFIEESWHYLVYCLTSGVLDAIRHATHSPDTFPLSDLRFQFPWELVDASWLAVSAAARLDDPRCKGHGPLTVSGLSVLESSLRQEFAKVVAGSRSAIPPEDRTIPMAYRRAAGLMGKGNSQDAAEWLSKSVADGSIPCEHISRQTHVFSRKFFPESVWHLIIPKVTATQPKST